MVKWLCVTCGTQYPARDQPPERCLICQDERQYVGLNGQQWTTLDALRQNHRNTFTDLVPGLTSIVTEPPFAIGQRAHLVRTPHGNILWDCISLIDDDTVAEMRRRGGIIAMAISHPHYYSTIVEWSRAFGSVPIYIHRLEQPWVVDPDPVIHFWDGESQSLLDGLTLIRCGGHFPGASVLHWRDGLAGQGLLLVGDTISVVADRRWVSFMYSYPNLIPLSPAEVQHIADRVEPLNFEQVYDAFGRIVLADGKNAVRHSAQRYIAAINTSHG